ncbi:MAG: hypothetical protein WC405_18560 [Syntrophales bacterium]
MNHRSQYLILYVFILIFDLLIVGLQIQKMCVDPAFNRFPILSFVLTILFVLSTIPYFFVVYAAIRGAVNDHDPLFKFLKSDFFREQIKNKSAGAVQHEQCEPGQQTIAKNPQDSHADNPDNSHRCQTGGL